MGQSYDRLNGRKHRAHIAMVAYTQLSFDARVLREAKAAAEAGFLVHFFTLTEDNPQNIEDFNNIIIFRSSSRQYKGHNKPAFVWSYIKFFFFCFVRVGWGFLLKRYRVIHVNNMPNFLVFACIIPKIFGAKIILDVHDLMPELFAAKFDLPLDHSLIRLLYLEERCSANFAKEVISTNRLHTERFVKNKIDGKTFPVILNAADEKIFAPVLERKFDDEIMTIVATGTINARYGYDVLLEAIARLNRDKMRVKLRILGDGEYRDQVVSMIENLRIANSIEMSNGFLPIQALAQQLNDCHIGMIPWHNDISSNFQMPNKIHEYFIKRLCVVGSDVNILREYFSDTIVFFRAGDSNDLYEKLIFLINNRSVMEAYAKKGFEFYEHSTWNHYKEQYVGLLRYLTRAR
jgi:glycosyltransferase involved in cell wall biosynthesis